MRLLWQELQVSSPAALWLMFLFSVGGLLVLLSWDADPELRFEYIAVVTEIVFPLGVMFLANGLILREREHNTLAFVAVRASLAILWLRRLGALLLLNTLCASSLLVIYHYFYLPISIVQMLFASLAVSLALAGVAGVVSLIFNEPTAGYIVAALWWGLCLINARPMFMIAGSHVYLFYFWFSSRENLDPGAWLLNKCTLAGVGLAMALIGAWLLRKPERLIV